MNIPVQIVGTGETVTLQNQDLFANYKPSELINDKVKNDIAAMFEEKGSLLTFLAIFLIGLALNLTPCVYPMLSVTVSLFGTQTETNIVHIFIKAVIYVLGMATMYSVLGVTAALGGGLFGSWLQSPWVLGGIAVLLFALALSSFGLYHIQMPYWLTSRLGGPTGSGYVAIYLVRTSSRCICRTMRRATGHCVVDIRCSKRKHSIWLLGFLHTRTRTRISLSHSRYILRTS